MHELVQIKSILHLGHDVLMPVLHVATGLLHRRRMLVYLRRLLVQLVYRRLILRISPADILDFLIDVAFGIVFARRLVLLAPAVVVGLVRVSLLRLVALRSSRPTDHFRLLLLIHLLQLCQLVALLPQLLRHETLLVSYLLLHLSHFLIVDFDSLLSSVVD